MFECPIPQYLSGSVYPLAGGFAGVKQTLRTMRALVNRYKVDPWMRHKAASLVFSTWERDEVAEVRAVFEFVRDSIRYLRDINQVETIQSPDKTLELRYGDCDDQSVLLATLLECIGYPTRFVVVGYSAPGAYEHVYVEAITENARIPMDPTERQEFGYEPPGAVSLYYEIL